MIPYLPEILKCVVDRVDKVLSNKEEDPFKVFFTHGNYSQVNKHVAEHKDEFPLIWLRSDYDEDRGKDYSVYADATCYIAVIIPTEVNYCQEERDDKTIKPRLLPIYQEFLKQLEAEPQLKTPPLNRIIHKKKVKPYWGGGEYNGTDSGNLFKQFVDALEISGLQFKIKHSTNCLSGQSQFIK